MSLYAQFVREMAGGEVIETDAGFISYLIEGEVCRFQELFVKADARGTGLHKSLWNAMIATCKQRDVKRVVWVVDTKQLNPTPRLIMYLRWGARVKDAQNNCIVLEYDLCLGQQ